MLHWALLAAAEAATLTSGSASPPQCVRSGIYVLDRERSDDVQQVITSAVAGLPNTDYFSRRLRKANTPGDEIRISNSPSRFSIKYETRPQILVLKSGEPTQLKLNDGQVFRCIGKSERRSCLADVPCQRQRADHSVPGRWTPVCGRDDDHQSAALHTNSLSAHL